MARNYGIKQYPSRASEDLQHPDRIPRVRPSNDPKYGMGPRDGGKPNAADQVEVEKGS